VFPGRVPPYRADQPCFRQKLPDLNGPAAAKAPPSSGPVGATTARTGSVRDARLRTLRSRLRPFGTRGEESR
jgi:phospholipid/cholesterol/gamma-HCH transport system substrate-binding protein